MAGQGAAPPSSTLRPLDFRGPETWCEDIRAPKHIRVYPGQTHVYGAVGSGTYVQDPEQLEASFMTYRPHALLRFGGRWFETEEWSCGLRVITDDSAATVQQWIDTLEPNEPGGIPVLLQDCADLVEAWFLRAGSQISNLARLDYVSMNAIGPDGKYADGGNPHTLEYAAGSAPTGPVNAAALPQVTVCLSFRTAQARGLATRGRIYPPTVIQATGGGRVGSTTAQGMADSAATLLEAIADLDTPFLAGGIRVGVVSDVGSPGPARIVTRVLVGDVFDTQRRRRNQLTETYVEAEVDTLP